MSWSRAATSRAALTEAEASADADGGCASVTYRDATVHDKAISPLILGGRAGRCYRYRVELLNGSGGVVARATSGALRSLTSWNGRNDLYRRGAFSTQKTLTWCVGASVQIMLNEIRGANDQSRRNQKTYMRYARAHDQHRLQQGPGQRSARAGQQPSIDTTGEAATRCRRSIRSPTPIREAALACD